MIASSSQSIFLDLSRLTPERTSHAVGNYSLQQVRTWARQLGIPTIGLRKEELVAILQAHLGC